MSGVVRGEFPWDFSGGKSSGGWGSYYGVFSDRSCLVATSWVGGVQRSSGAGGKTLNPKPTPLVNHPSILVLWRKLFVIRLFKFRHITVCGKSLLKRWTHGRCFPLCGRAAVARLFYTAVQGSLCALLPPKYLSPTVFICPVFGRFIKFRCGKLKIVSKAERQEILPRTGFRNYNPEQPQMCGWLEFN